MDMTKYQEQAATTSQPQGDAILHAVFGLVAEAGEVATLYQKYHRGDFDYVELERKLKGELGDVLWYLTEVCTRHQWWLGDIAQGNLDKLASRAARGKIEGAGDDR
jgi:NTP pyrophosphatase (non-canonical NTP hydrolase)